jgi:hypothetical protein
VRSRQRDATEQMLSRVRGSGRHARADADVVSAGVPSAASTGRRRTWGTREALGLGLGLMLLMALLSLLTVGHVAHRTRHPHHHASDGLGYAAHPGFGFQRASGWTT